MNDQIASDYELHIVLETLEETRRRGLPGWLESQVDDAIEIVDGIRKNLERKVNEQIEQA